MKQKKKIKNIVLATVFGIVLFVSVLAYFSANWYISVFGDMGFESILSTLTTGVGGTAGDLTGDYLKGALIPSVLSALVATVFLFGLTKRKLMLYIGKKLRLCLYPFSRFFAVLISLILSIALVCNAAVIVGLDDYIKVLKQYSTIFEKEYVDPEEVEIKFPKTKRNLIYIWLESMETSFLPTDLGGGNDVNPISELYELAKDNVNFSQNNSVGGFYSPYGTNWTIGALVAQTSGIPLKTPLGIAAADYGKDSFLPGITSLSNVLEKAGYYQALMVGSRSEFGSRKQYFEQHGVDKIYDLHVARNTGVIPKDYCVWWGMEDAKLFDWAKEELVKISEQEKLFAFSMLTVDTHHVGGYVCDLCENNFDEQYENVLACSSRQVLDFVNWIKKQDFYENTTIIICGDHPTMDAEYISSNLVEGYKRVVYNCYINAAVEPVKEKNRVSSTVDLFPTALAAIGCKIPGERLGLGTNLFSEKSTICENISLEKFEQELAKKSKYYENNFYSKE